MEKTIDGDYGGDLMVGEGAWAAIDGDVNGSAEIGRGAKATIGGDLNGDLDTCGDVEVGGSVNGTVRAAGGKVKIGE